ncbi:MAG TPA: hypothetical protein VFY83_10840 [Anaerolineales bacterium]|nr:hypothetical protein [Anaerolineales bacterium]
MIMTAVQLKWNRFRQNLINGWNKRRSHQFTKLNNMRERSIIILQKRYGYTREQAIDQLDKHYPRAWLG